MYFADNSINLSELHCGKFCSSSREFFATSIISNTSSSAIRRFSSAVSMSVRSLSDGCDFQDGEYDELRLQLPRSPPRYLTSPLHKLPLFIPRVSQTVFHRPKAILPIAIMCPKEMFCWKVKKEFESRDYRGVITIPHPSNLSLVSLYRTTIETEHLI